MEYYTDISDHLPIFLLTKLNNYNIGWCNNIETRVYTDHIVTLFRSSINTLCWNDVYASEDPQKVILHF